MRRTQHFFAQLGKISDFSGEREKNDFLGSFKINEKTFPLISHLASPIHQKSFGRWCNSENHTPLPDTRLYPTCQQTTTYLSTYLKLTF